MTVELQVNIASLSSDELEDRMYFITNMLADLTVTKTKIEKLLLSRGGPLLPNPICPIRIGYLDRIIADRDNKQLVSTIFHKWDNYVLMCMCNSECATRAAIGQDRVLVSVVFLKWAVHSLQEVAERTLLYHNLLLDRRRSPQ